MAEKCPYCSSAVVVASSLKVYRRDYGPILICSQYPKCDAYVGCHKHDGKPLGTLANGQLRALRMQCHAVIDPLWQSGKAKRKAVYRKISELLGIERSETHVAMFDEERCRALLVVSAELRGSVEKLATEGLAGAERRDSGSANTEPK